MVQQTYIGIDIFKAWLDIFIPGQGFHTVCNDAVGIAELVTRGSALKAWLIFESRGSYERALVHALDAASIPFSRINPRQALDFARATGLAAKTDRIDARMLGAVRADA